MLNFPELGGAAPATTMYGYGRRTQVRPAFIMTALLAMLLFALMRVGMLQYSSLVQKNLPGVTFASTLRTAAPQVSAAATSTAANPPTLSTQPAPAAAAASVVPGCTPDTGYALPTTLDLGASNAGVTQVVDAPYYYQIYGYTGSQIEQQIAQCAPRLSGAGGVFTAYTSYALSWNYNYFVTSSGKCLLTDEKIGVHVNQVFPIWQNTSSADAGLDAKWQTFMTDLKTHEQGHVQLDLQYANQMLSDMQTFPATDCGTIKQAVNTKLNNDVALLNQANDDYDTRTNHGATQGAIIP